MLDFVIEDVKKILDSIYKLTNFPLSFIDENRVTVYHASPTSAAFCQEVSKHRQLRSKCLECDNNGFKLSQLSGKTNIYLCHSGFTEIHIPILHENKILGYLITGQILCTENYDYAFENAIKIEEEYNLPKGTFANLIKQTKVYDREYVESFIHIVETCLSHMFLSNIMTVKAPDLTDRIKEYIDNNLNQDLSVQALCEVFYLSRAKLYTISASSFGAGISVYVLQRRIQKAKQLLRKTYISVSQIAEETGFSDHNYFSRVFKKLTGQSPSEYRKSFNS